LLNEKKPAQLARNIRSSEVFLFGLKNSGQYQMTHEVLSAPRFLVRQGCKGWMVYDRERKGPALVGTNPAANLTREEAEHIQRMLTAKWERKQNRS
jgi:hypothetical protein